MRLFTRRKILAAAGLGGLTLIPTSFASLRDCVMPLKIVADPGGATQYEVRLRAQVYKTTSGEYQLRFKPPLSGWKSLVLTFALNGNLLASRIEVEP